MAPWWKMRRAILQASKKKRAEPLPAQAKHTLRQYTLPQHRQHLLGRFPPPHTRSKAYVSDVHPLTGHEFKSNISPSSISSQLSSNVPCTLGKGSIRLARPRCRVVKPQICPPLQGRFQRFSSSFCPLNPHTCTPDLNLIRSFNTQLGEATSAQAQSQANSQAFHAHLGEAASD